ncbi:TrkH family potassium uptake protein [uncultured Ruminococcus sp.]|uniref:TrkH family potassium uptake protein n=1 Tax=uncultured Ruminococcus sp. TaxID=165186 RepID=UPI00261EA402|nr:TrkH family potassium uptake protein [uncultured Ruminococcus sp.]
MNKGIVFHYLSRAMLIGSALFLIPAAVSLYFREYFCAGVFLLVGICVAAVSLPFSLIRPKNKNMFAREGMVIAALLWVLFSVAGGLPFYLSGCIPSFCDAVFESVSGFTTTGSTILTDIEALPKGMLFWRSFTHWVGGMGVLVLAIAIMPSSSHALYLMRAECPGPQVSKLVPKGKNSAMYLYLIYTGLTIVTTILLAVGGMPLFDSVCHAMGIAGTGGFSIKNDGIAFYNSPYLEGVATVTMLLFGVNFSLYYFILIRRFREVRKNTELKVYLGIFAVFTLLIMANTHSLYQTIGKTFRYAVFQVASIMTSTGFATADYNQWPMFSQMLLLILMYIGACGGSTGGGFKVQRFVILCKSGALSMRKMLHPNSVSLVKSDDKTMNEETVYGVVHYLILYLGIVLASMLLLSLNDLDFGTTISAVSTCVNNIGPGMNQVGPMENFSFLSDFSKVVLTADMLLGRLECLPLLILLAPSVWRKNF